MGLKGLSIYYKFKQTCDISRIYESCQRINS